MRSRSLLVLAAIVVAVPVFHALAQDQDASPQAPVVARDNRLVIRSKARIVAPADELELEIVVQGSAEEARTAEKKHRDRLRRVLASLTGKEVAKDDEDSSDDDDKTDKPKKKKTKHHDEEPEALPALGVPDEDGLVLDVREGRYTLGVKSDSGETAMDANGDPVVKTDGELACGSCIHVTLKNLQKSSPRKVRKLLANLLDRAADGGADFGGPKTHLKPTLRFRVANAEALKKQAYAEAITRGRARAADLAQLAGRKLGNLTVLSDLPEVGQAVGQDDGHVSDYEVFLANLQAADASSPDTFSGSSEIAIEVGVELEFDLR